MTSRATGSCRASSSSRRSTLTPRRRPWSGSPREVWQHASMAESTTSAIAKLRAAGVEPDASQLGALEPSVQATESAFEPLLGVHRIRVSFTYRDGASAPSSRGG